MSIKIFISSLIVVCSFTVNAGGPWTQVKGEGYFKLSEWGVIFDQHFTDEGKLDPNVTTGVLNTNLYAEFGFSNRFTGIVNGAVFSRNYMNNVISKTTEETLFEGDAVNSFGDIDLGLKYSLRGNDKKYPMAVSLYFGLPTGKSVAGGQNNLQTGDGEFNQMLIYDIGHGFQFSGKVKGYWSANFGLNHRTNNYSSEIRSGAEVGAGLFKEKLWLILKTTDIQSLRNGATAESVTSTSVFANNTEYTSISLQVAYYIKGKWGVSASVATATRGQVIAAAPSYSVGVFFDMSK